MTSVSAQAPFDTVESAIQDIAAGRLVIVTDDENRENEGDLIMAAAKAGQLRFGQLIQESAKRYNGVSLWIHISLGAPWRAAERSGQCLTMSGGVYTMVYHV